MIASSLYALHGAVIQLYINLTVDECLATVRDVPIFRSNSECDQHELTPPKEWETVPYVEEQHADDAQCLVADFHLQRLQKN